MDFFVYDWNTFVLQPEYSPFAHNYFTYKKVLFDVRFAIYLELNITKTIL